LPVRPPAASTASATRDPAASRYTPGWFTAPTTCTHTDADALASPDVGADPLAAPAAMVPAEAAAAPCATLPTSAVDAALATPDAPSRGHQRHAASTTATPNMTTAPAITAGGIPASPARRASIRNRSSTSSRNTTTPPFASNGGGSVVRTRQGDAGRAFKTARTTHHALRVLPEPDSGLTPRRPRR